MTKLQHRILALSKSLSWWCKRTERSVKCLKENFAPAQGASFLCVVATASRFAAPAAKSFFSFISAHDRPLGRTEA